MPARDLDYIRDIVIFTSNKRTIPLSSWRFKWQTSGMRLTEDLRVTRKDVVTCTFDHPLDYPIERNIWRWIYSMESAIGPLQSWWRLWSSSLGTASRRNQYRKSPLVWGTSRYTISTCDSEILTAELAPRAMYPRRRFSIFISGRCFRMPRQKFISGRLSNKFCHFDSAWGA